MDAGASSSSSSSSNNNSTGNQYFASRVELGTSAAAAALPSGGQLQGAPQRPLPAAPAKGMLQPAGGPKGTAESVAGAGAPPRDTSSRIPPPIPKTVWPPSAIPQAPLPAKSSSAASPVAVPAAAGAGGAAGAAGAAQGVSTNPSGSGTAANGVAPPRSAPSAVVVGQRERSLTPLESRKRAREMQLKDFLLAVKEYGSTVPGEATRFHLQRGGLATSNNQM
ncbi:unnamed protein product [Laminaria digitata]